MEKQGGSAARNYERMARLARLGLYGTAAVGAAWLIRSLLLAGPPSRIDLSLGDRYPLEMPPIPLQLPWVSGAVGWTVLFASLGLAAASIVLERRNRTRVDPLVPVAVAFGILGCAELIAGVRAMNAQGAWPVNLLHLGLEILVLAGAVAAVAVLRLVRSKRAIRGRVAGAITVVGCFALAGIAYDALFVRLFPQPVQDGINLPGTGRFRGYVGRDDSERLNLRVRADGVVEFPDGYAHEPGAGSESLIEKLSAITDCPWCGELERPDPVVLWVDSATRWGRIEQLLLALGSREVRAWLVELAVDWNAPRCATKIDLNLGCEWGLMINRASPSGHRDLSLAVGGGLALDGVPVSSLEELTLLAEHTIDTTFTEEALPSLITIVPDPDTPWSELVAVINAAQSLERLALAREPRSLFYSASLRLGGGVAWLD